MKIISMVLKILFISNLSTQVSWGQDRSEYIKVNDNGIAITDDRYIKCLESANSATRIFLIDSLKNYNTFNNELLPTLNDKITFEELRNISIIFEMYKVLDANKSNESIEKIVNKYGFKDVNTNNVNEKIVQIYKNVPAEIQNSIEKLTKDKIINYFNIIKQALRTMKQNETFGSYKNRYYADDCPKMEFQNNLTNMSHSNEWTQSRGLQYFTMRNFIIFANGSLDNEFGDVKDIIKDPNNSSVFFFYLTRFFSRSIYWIPSFLIESQGDQADKLPIIFNASERIAAKENAEENKEPWQGATTNKLILHTKGIEKLFNTKGRIREAANAASTAYIHYTVFLEDTNPLQPNFDDTSFENILAISIWDAYLRNIVNKFDDYNAAKK